MKHLIHLMLLIGFIFPAKLMAQEFSVESFRQLPNDVSAFINVVYDLNDDACALVKVTIPSRSMNPSRRVASSRKRSWPLR